MTVLEVFCHSITRRIEIMTVRKGESGEWKWSSVDAALEVTGNNCGVFSRYTNI